MVAMPVAGCCVVDADCDDGDPCTTDTCVGGDCHHTDLTGVPGARCVCERAAVAACRTDTVPTKIAKKAAAACTTLDHAAKATKPKARTKLLKKAVRAWKALAKLVGKPAAARRLSAQCVAGLKTAYGDAAGRADRALLAP